MAGRMIAAIRKFVRDIFLRLFQSFMGCASARRVLILVLSRKTAELVDTSQWKSERLRRQPGSDATRCRYFGKSRATRPVAAPRPGVLPGRCAWRIAGKRQQAIATPSMTLLLEPWYITMTPSAATRSPIGCQLLPVQL